MSSYTVFEAKRAVRIRKSGSRYLAVVDGTAVFGAGDSIEGALGELDRRYRDLVAFADDTGLQLETLIGRERTGQRDWVYQLRYAAIVVVCFGLMTVPLSYALSTALERTVVNLHLNGGPQFWRGLQDGLIEAAERSDSSPEEQARTVAALRVMIQRTQPYLDEIKSIFGCSDGKESTKR
jgi:hypothetical protein